MGVVHPTGVGSPMAEPQRAALITGGTRGIGLGIAEALAAQGYRLVLNGTRPEDDVLKTLDAVRALGVEVHYVRGDIGSRADRDRLASAAEQRYGYIDLLVNNAGVSSRDRGKDLLEATEEGFEWLMKINLQGPHFLTQRIVRGMIAGKRADPTRAPAVVNITSISAGVVSTGRGDYCVSKAALSMATKVWAARLAEFGIPVYEVRPGIIQTDMTAGVEAKYDALIRDGLLLEARWGTPEDIGKSVAMLARGDLPYASGQVLVLDGGLTMRRL